METRSFTPIAGLAAEEGAIVHVRGHVHAIRRLGSIVFLVIRDRSGLIQAVVDSSELVEQARSVTPETPIAVLGQVVPQQKGRSGVELQVRSFATVAEPASVLPVEISKENKMSGLSLPTMLDYRPLTLRAPSVRAIFEIEAEICAGFREHLSKLEPGGPFVEINSPKLVSTGTEGGAQLFKLEYFGKTAYLAQSPQFYKQMMVGVFERVYEIGPVYRAEEHDTSRHINEYVSMDVEMGFIENHFDVMGALERVINHVIARLQENKADQLETVGAKLPKIKAFPVISLPEAVTILTNKMGWQGESSNQPVGDLDPSGERLLCQYIAKETGNDFVFVTGYSRTVRPFYAMPEEETGSTKSFDLLFRGAEISTGGQRIHEYAKLVESIRERNMSEESFADYLQCFRYGMPPHGGFAIGLERFTQQLLGLSSVKLASLFPRDCNRLTP